jgi:hypothetical protein
MMLPGPKQAAHDDPVQDSRGKSVILLLREVKPCLFLLKTSSAETIPARRRAISNACENRILIKCPGMLLEVKKGNYLALDG